MKLKYILSLLSVALVLVACEKAFMGCTVYVDTQIQLLEKDISVKTNKFDGYVLYADTAEYTVLNFEDASNGVYTNRITGAKKSFQEQALYDNPSGYLVFNNLTETKAIILIVDRENFAYAYKSQLVVRDLANLYLKFVMPVWKFTVKEFKDNTWVFKRDETIPVPEPEPKPEPAS